MNYDCYGKYASTWLDEIRMNDSLYSGNGLGFFFLRKLGYVLQAGYDYKNVEFKGWAAFDQKIEEMGYRVNHGEPVFVDFEKEAPEAEVIACGGQFAKRFDIVVPTADFAVGSYSIELVAELEDGTVIIMNGEPKYINTEAGKKFYGNILSTITYITARKPEMTEIGRRVCEEAKWVADFCRENKFIYGDAPINPGFNCEAKKCSCDRLVEWTLYRLGFTNQPERQGLVVYAPGRNDLSEWCEEQGFDKITDYGDLVPGDLVFIKYSLDRPEHTFVFAGFAGDSAAGNVVRYDAGSTDRMHTYQPYVQNSYVRPNHTEYFMWAYRVNRLPNA